VTLLGIDIGGTSIKAVRLGVDKSVDFAVEVTKETVIEAVIHQVGDLVESLGDSETVGVGIGVAGLVTWPDGRFAWGPHVQGENVEIRARIGSLVGLPVVVDNDANCAALAESTMGAAVGVANAIILTLGTGIGAGIVVEGSVYRGQSFAGEAGHMTMVPEGELCACGRRGCWETLVSGRRFAQDARRIVQLLPDGLLAGTAAGSEPDGSHLGMAADAGDQASRQAIIEAGRWLGRGIANLVALLDPELIVVGGAAVAVGELLLSTAREESNRTVEGAGHRRAVRVEVASLGPWAGAIGAAFLVGGTGKPFAISN